MRIALAIVIAVVIFVAVVVAAYYLINWGANSTAGVQITAVDWSFSGATNCWTSSTSAGITGGTSSEFAATTELTYTAGLFEPSSCTVQSVSIQTPGFSLVNSNAPIVVHTGGEQTLSVTVESPSSPFFGALTIVVTVSSP